MFEMTMCCGEVKRFIRNSHDLTDRVGVREDGKDLKIVHLDNKGKFFP